ncbi:MAG: heme-dependent oxidative N-demethylase subunit alpha family protein, partial [Sneathiella sp.]
GLNSRIGKPIDRFFRNLRAGKKVERFNWGLYDSSALFQPSWWREERAVDTSIARENVGSKIFFRVERQTLQRLGEDPDILFTIRIFNNSLAEVCESGSRAKRLLHGLQTMNADMRAYKSLPRYEHLITDYLKQATA